MPEQDEAERLWTRLVDMHTEECRERPNGGKDELPRATARLVQEERRAEREAIARMVEAWLALNVYGSKSSSELVSRIRGRTP